MICLNGIFRKSFETIVYELKNRIKNLFQFQKYYVARHNLKNVQKLHGHYKKVNREAIKKKVAACNSGELANSIPRKAHPAEATA